jgi:hypothetical protein
VEKRGIMILRDWVGLKDKVGVIQTARNRFGRFKVAEKYKTPLNYNGKEILWSKHIDVLDIWETGEWWRIEKANNRQILECEIVLDVDPEKGETIIEIFERTRKIAESLTKDQIIFDVYFSGSRGYHLHLIVPRLASYSPRDRKLIRERFLKKYNCDLQKASDNTLIAMENCPHWKTGKKKVVVTNELIN